MATIMAAAAAGSAVSSFAKLASSSAAVGGSAQAAAPLRSGASASLVRWECCVYFGELPFRVIGLLLYVHVRHGPCGYPCGR
jgi:hypothetical protein